MRKVYEMQMSLLSRRRSGQGPDFISLTYHSLYLKKMTRLTLYTPTMFCAMSSTERSCLPISFVSSSGVGDSCLAMHLLLEALFRTRRLRQGALSGCFFSALPVRMSA